MKQCMNSLMTIIREKGEETLKLIQSHNLGKQDRVSGV